MAKEGNLFVWFVCNVERSHVECSSDAIGTIGKPSMSKGALWWFGNVLTLNLWCKGY